MLRNREKQQRQEPREKVRPRQPVKTGTAKQERHGSSGEKEIAAQRKSQPRSAPNSERNGQCRKKCHSGQASNAVSTAEQRIRQPFPGEPWPALPRVGEAVHARRSGGFQNSFAVANVPAGIGVPEQTLSARREKQHLQE